MTHYLRCLSLDSLLEKVIVEFQQLLRIVGAEKLRVESHANCQFACIFYNHENGMRLWSNWRSTRDTYQDNIPSFYPPVDRGKPLMKVPDWIA